MKKSTLYLFTSFILPALGAIVLYANSTTKKEEVTKGLSIFNQQNDSIPLLVLHSFMNVKEEISKGELLRGIEEGEIFCTSDLRDYLKLTLKLENYPKVIALKEFDFKSKSELVITTLDSVDHRFIAVKVDSINFFKDAGKYPLWKNDKKGHFDYAKQITSYNHTGVTALTRQTGVTLDIKGIDFYLANILSYFRYPEITHVSNEVSMIDTCTYGTMKLKFATKSKHFEVLKRLNVNIVELTGNHNLDVGKESYLSTLKWYKDNGIQYFGGGGTPSEANSPLILELKDNSRIAWVGFNQMCPLGECADNKPGANRYQDLKAKMLIDSLKNQLKVSSVIACVQFGETDSYSPTETQNIICKKLIDYGVDVIIGSQAHQAQEIALYKGKMIFYGLGNFLFDQIHRIGVRQAFFLECYFYKGKIIQFQPVYTYMNDQRQPTIANPDQKAQIQKAILKSTNF